MFGWHADPKPEMAARSREIGEACNAVGYDIVGLCEVFEQQERERILAGFDGPVESRYGPKEDWRTLSGGTQTIVPNENFEIVRMATHRYQKNGLRQRDADAWASKGVLYTEIDVGPGRIDLFTTHLFAGGGLPWCEDSGGDRATVRAAQIEELTAFVEAQRRPENVTVIGGDFNTTASRPAYDGTIVPMMDQLGVYDAWVRHGDGHGGTNDDAFGGGCEIDPDAGLPYPCTGPAEEAGRRIDYVFIEEPTDDHALELAVDRMNRVTFWRENGDPASFYTNDGSPGYMGDHMGLDLTLSVTPTGEPEPTESGTTTAEEDGSLPLGLGAIGGAAIGVLGAASAGVYRQTRQPAGEPDRSMTGRLSYPLGSPRSLLGMAALSLLLVPGILLGATRIGSPVPPSGPNRRPQHSATGQGWLATAWPRSRSTCRWGCSPSWCSAGSQPLDSSRCPRWH
ncbi:MAG: endonuclease/exonuclease/phosphatase family protein [Natrialbaceae archaeon]|nr:endonuclease/exonuclease/phosphatase family protein [Natrialbaceae archaeon]